MAEHLATVSPMSTMRSRLVSERGCLGLRVESAASRLRKLVIAALALASMLAFSSAFNVDISWKVSSTLMRNALSDVGEQTTIEEVARALTSRAWTASS